MKKVVTMPVANDASPPRNLGILVCVVMQSSPQHAPLPSFLHPARFLPPPHGSPLRHPRRTRRRHPADAPSRRCHRPHEDFTARTAPPFASDPRAWPRPTCRRTSCAFPLDGVFVGPLTVLDLSTVGFAAEPRPHLALAPGSVLESFQLLIGDRPIWTGDAVLVHGSAERIGARFTSGMVDLRHLCLGATMDQRLASQVEQRGRLPADWRAAVGDMRLLLEDVRLEMDEVERRETNDPCAAATRKQGFSSACARAGGTPSTSGRGTSRDEPRFRPTYGGSRSQLRDGDADAHHDGVPASSPRVRKAARIRRATTG